MGGIDAHIGMFGTNAFTEGKLAINMGTSFCILGNINDSSKKLNSFWCPYKHAVVDGMGCIEVGQSSAAGLVNYFRGKYLVVINKSQTSSDSHADLVINDSLGKVFGRL